MSDTPSRAASWLTDVTPPRCRVASAQPDRRQDGPRPPPGVAMGQGCPGHLHQLEDVVRLPILGHLRGNAMRGGGRVHAASPRGRSLGTAVARASRHQQAPLPRDRRCQGRHAAPSSARVALAPPPPPHLLRGEVGAGSGSGSPQPHEGSAPQLRPRPPTLRASAGNPKSPPAAVSWLRGPPPVLRHPTVSRGHIGPGEAGGGSYFCFRQGALAQAFGAP